MAGKRKRTENTAAAVVVSKVETAKGKPLSAIAAARLRAEVSAKAIIPSKTTQDPVPIPPVVPPESPESDPEESEPEEEPITTQQNFKLCNWKINSEEILSDTNTELTVNLKKHLTIALIGSFDLKVLRGAVNINGANIGAVTREGQKAKAYRVFVPATHPISKIRGLDGTNHVQFLSCREPTPFTKISPLFRDIWNAKAEVEKDRSFGVITESSNDPLLRPLTPELTPEEHLRAIETIVSSPSTTLITGPPSTGKSIFARRLTNRYLTGLGKNAHPVPAVCYLDLDPLKPEYTPPGQISLIVVRELNLGPSFTHPTTIPGVKREEEDEEEEKANETIRAHAIPTDLANYEDYYQQCIEDLFLTYKSIHARSPSLPLIINTPGFLSTTNLAILPALQNRSKPQHVIHFTSSAIPPPIMTTATTATSLLPPPLPSVPKTAHTTHHLLPAITALSPPLRSDTDLQTMHTQSYFHLTTPSASASSPPTWTSKPLSHHPPFTLHYTPTASHAQSLLAILPLTPSAIPAASLLHALNGAVIHIIQTASYPLPTSPSPSPSPSHQKGPHAETPTSKITIPHTPKSHIPFFPPNPLTGSTPPPDPRSTRLLCTALIRGFDPQKRQVQILVPRSVEAALGGLAREDGGGTVFVLGCGGVAEWAFVEDAMFGAAGGRGEERGGGELGPWVERRGVVDGMGYLGRGRRVRKFMV